jgi:hypothetical protein
LRAERSNPGTGITRTASFPAGDGRIDPLHGNGSISGIIWSIHIFFYFPENGIDFTSDENRYTLKIYQQTLKKNEISISIIINRIGRMYGEAGRNRPQGGCRTS